jgi:predicted peroxiredoxin
MQGLTIIVAGSDPARLHAALSIAAAWSALGRPAHIFLQADAVALLRANDRQADDRYRGVGMATVSELVEETLSLGVSVTACQSGLALAGMEAGDLPEGIETGGLVELLSTRREDQLLMA